MAVVLDPRRLGDVVSAYLDKAVLPAASPSETVKIVSMVLLLNRAAPALLESNKGLLQAAGMLDADGRIRIDALREYGRELINKTGKISALGFRFGADDIDSLYEIARQFSTVGGDNDDGT